MNSAYDSPEAIAKWHEFRRQHVMASDTPNLCGVGYRDALSVYCDKTEPLPAEQSPEMLAGLLFEPGIARWFELHTGIETRSIQHAQADEYGTPWLGATADREAADGNLVEIKKVSQHKTALWGEPGTSEVPDAVQIQAQQQMVVYGRAKVYVPILLGECDFRLYVVPRDDAIIDPLIPITREFWDSVQNRQPPDPDFTHHGTSALLSRIHRPEPGKEIILGKEFTQLASEYLEWGDEIHVAEANRDEIKGRLIHAMQDAQTARVGEFTITRREIGRKEKAREAREVKYFDFRIRQPKSVPVS